MDLDAELVLLDTNFGNPTETEDEDDNVDTRDYDEIITSTPRASTSQTFPIDTLQVDFEQSKEDLDESAEIEGMFGEEVEQCCNQKCNKILPKSLVQKFRDGFLEMTKDEQDLVVLSQLEILKEHENLLNVYKIRGRYRGKDDGAKKERCYNSYAFLNVEICKKMYLYIHNIGKTRFKNLQKHFRTNGVVPRRHGSANKTSNRFNIISTEVLKAVVTLIQNYAEKFAVPLPGRMPRFKDYKVMKLPSCETKMSIYRKFIEPVGTNSRLKIRDRSFRNIWNLYVPYITTMRPAYDLCDLCKQNSLALFRTMNNKPSEEKIAQLNKALRHLNDANRQREYYQNWCKRKESSTAVLSFDFAQNVAYPSSPQQVGTSYFKSGRKCSLFGVVNEVLYIQHNYLIDESRSVGKEPNCVVSLLHHYLENFLPKGIRVLVLFADNCAAQNKNNYMLAHLSWRIAIKKHDRILFNFLMTGHTRFTPDRFFGLLKQSYGKHDVDTFEDVMECVRKSTQHGQNVAVDAFQVRWLNENGIQYRILAYGENEQCTLSLTQIDASSFPVEIHPSGLSLERQWYLFDQVRQLCTDPTKSDLVAPEPKEPRPRQSKKLETQSEQKAQYEKKEATKRVAEVKKAKNESKTKEDVCQDQKDEFKKSNVTQEKSLNNETDVKKRGRPRISEARELNVEGNAPLKKRGRPRKH